MNRSVIALAAIALALAPGLSACNKKSAEAAPARPLIGATPAGLSFDGAGGDAAAMRAHGERLSHVLGCRGCHQENLEGAWFNEDTPDMGKLYASNLTRVLPTMSDAQLRRLLRDGVHPTRGDLWVMPSKVFQRLSEADVNALIAHLRTVKAAGAQTPPPAMSAKAKAMVARGEEHPESYYVAQYKQLVPVDLGPRYALGRYLASNTCAECHGPDLSGVPDFGKGVSTPNLTIAASYSDAELTRLLTSGQGRTPRDLGLMSLVGKGHFAYFTPHERAAVVAYVKARAARLQ
ncbi:c-type cytochrome [Sphingomonas sp. ASV193]|uniref:c-type cytochrome n=1 Tax=Sphingomonas sp. ASV193 TaxID=3144405 RepID=UPI0032E91BB7